jgi:hypothetical protein
MERNKGEKDQLDSKGNDYSARSAISHIPADKLKICLDVLETIKVSERQLLADIKNPDQKNQVGKNVDAIIRITNMIRFRREVPKAEIITMPLDTFTDK